jgi:Ala-tRNA(Pro) deacylase
MTMLKRCLVYLKQNGVRYAHSTHSPAVTAADVALAERMPIQNLAKTVVYSGDNGFGMLVLPADAIVDFRDVKRLLGIKETRLATEAEIEERFPECEVGAMPPFGNLFNMPVLLDQELAGVAFIAFTVGTHRDAIHISLKDYRELTKIASFGLTVPVLVSGRDDR